MTERKTKEPIQVYLDDNTKKIVEKYAAKNERSISGAAARMIKGFISANKLNLLCN